MLTKIAKTQSDTHFPHRLWIAGLIGLITLALTMLATPSQAAAEEGDTHAFDNPNEVSWREVNSFVNHEYKEVPLREGQHDYGQVPGFGVRHIQDRHGEVPPSWELEETIENGASCSYDGWRERWHCWNGESLLMLVYTFNGHYDAPAEDADDPLGIITAFRQLGPPCYIAKKNSANCAPPEAHDSALHYDGPDSAVNGQPLEVSAYLTDDKGITATGRDVSFSLGSGDNAQSCTATTDDSGLAVCTIDTVNQVPGSGIPLRMDFAGDKGYKATSQSVNLSAKSPTKIKWKSPEYIANGTAQTLEAKLTDTFADEPVANQKVSLSLGEDEARQECTGATEADGIASCTIDSVDQPLNDSAKVKAGASFAGNNEFLASKDITDVKLEYYTGQAYGVAADMNLPVVDDIVLQPQPHTGDVRTAKASTSDPGCTSDIDTAVITVGSLCPKMETALDPGRSTASSSVAEASIGLPGIADIEVSGLSATAESTCEAATGSTTVKLRINGENVPVPDTPNARIDLAGGGEIIVNEQIDNADADADEGITVTGLRISDGAGLVDITLAQATSAVHQCAS